MEPTQLASVVNGTPVTDTGAESPGGTGVYRSGNPSRLDDTVAMVRLAGAATFRRAAEAARQAQQPWAEVPAPVRGRVVANLGRLVEANKEALAALVTREWWRLGPPSMR